MSIVWKDDTAYGRSDTQRIPRVWSAEIIGERLIVHRFHGCEGWFVSGHGYDKHQLKSTEADQAKAEAVERLRQKAKRLLAALEPTA